MRLKWRILGKLEGVESAVRILPAQVQGNGRRGEATTSPVCRAANAGVGVLSGH